MPRDNNGDLYGLVRIKNEVLNHLKPTEAAAVMRVQIRELEHQLGSEIWTEARRRQTTGGR